MAIILANAITFDSFDAAARQQGSKGSNGSKELENVNSGRFRELPEALEL